MPEPELTIDVQAFLREHVHSYEELEILLLLSRERTNPWTVGAICLRVNIPAPPIEEAVRTLCSRGLVELSSGAPVQYRLASSLASNQALQRLADSYSSRSIELVKLMNALAIERVRTAALHTFANAFVFRRDKDHG